MNDMEPVAWMKSVPATTYYRTHDAQTYFTSNPDLDGLSNSGWTALYSKEQIGTLHRQLAESQAREAVLRENLPTRTPGGFVSFGKNYAEAEDKFNDPRNPMCKFKRVYLDNCDHLATIPTDDITLRQMITKAGDVMRERSILFSKKDGWILPSEIRALPGVTLEDLQG